MACLIFAIDHDEMSELREGFRNDHRKHLRSVGKKLLGSGALLSDTGEAVIGGISLLDTDNIEVAKKFASDDPYSKAGIRKETRVLRWRRRWVDGEFIN